MKDNIKVMIYFVLFVVFMILAYVGYNTLSKREIDSKLESNEVVNNNKEEEKEKLAEFNLYLENGEKVSSEEILEGKPAVINIWTSWCKYCDIEMEYFNEMYLKEKDNVRFIMINATGDRDTKEAAKEYVMSNGFSFEIYYDMNLEAINKLRINSYPTTIFVDENGYIVSYNVGMITREKLERKIERLK